MAYSTLLAALAFQSDAGSNDPEPESLDDVNAEIGDSVESFVDNLVDSAPRLLAAVTILVVGYLLSKVVRSIVCRLLARNHVPSFARVMSKIAGWAFLGLTFMAASAVAFPSVKPVDLLAGLGFFSIAIGFAFQDILENTLSGVLLLVREPFRSGDQISVAGHEGTVQQITIRETQLRQYDGQLLVIPNRDVYKNAIRVQTNEDLRRVSFVVGVAYEDDLQEAQKTILDSLEGLDAIANDPRPEALVANLGVSTVDIDVRFWVDSSQHGANTATSDAIIAVKGALDAGGFEMPCDIVALQATDSFRAAVYDRPVSASGSLVDQ